MQRSTTVGQYFILGIALAIAVLFADQATKWMIINYLQPEHLPDLSFVDWFFTQKKISFFVNERETFQAVVLTPFLNLVMVWNQGVSFGMFENNTTWMPLVFIAISLIASLLMIIWLAVVTEKKIAIPLGLIIGGAIGNAIDRVRFGAVADFIDVHAGGMHWPAFNVADGAITLGAIILIISSFMSEDKNVQPQP